MLVRQNSKSIHVRNGIPRVKETLFSFEEALNLTPSVILHQISLLSQRCCV